MASSRSTNHSRSSTGQLAAALVPGTLELLGKARDALKYDAFLAVDAEVVCALALAASGGHEALEVWCDDIAETRLGICQVRNCCCSATSPLYWSHSSKCESAISCYQLLRVGCGSQQAERHL